MIQKLSFERGFEKKLLVIPHLWLLSNVTTAALKVVARPILYKIDEASKKTFRS